jgi:hypothetical protein
MTIETPVIERRDDAPAAGGCCEPECGPEACEPTSSGLAEADEREARAEAGCCEPECGPDTCAS